MGLLKLWHRIFNVVTLATIMIAFHIGGCVQEVAIRQEANAIIGVIMQVSERGTGVFGCGSPTQEGVVKFEAMRWMLSVLNQRRGPSFLPGVSIGLRVFDTCGRLRVAVTQLGEFLPALKGVNNTIFIPSAIKIGLLDDAHLSDDHEVQAALDELRFPVIKLDSDTMVVPSEQKAKAILSMAKQLKWHQVIVVHGDDSTSTRLAQLILQLAASSNDVCVLSMEQFASVGDQSNERSDEDLKNSNQNMMQSLFSENQEIPILVLMQQSSIRNFIESLNNHLHANNTSSLQLFFSNLLTHEDISLLPAQISTLYSLSIQTDHLHVFEEYWQDRIRHIKQTRIYPSQENEWLWSYLRSRQQCVHSQLESSALHQECTDQTNSEDDLHIALRAEDVLTASQAIVVMAQAIQRAWEVICFNGNRHPCPELMKMSHQDFQQLYFTEVLQNQRSGLKLPQQNRDWLKEPSSLPTLLLVQYVRNSQQRSFIGLHKIMEFSAENELQILDTSFEPDPPELCVDCGLCLHATHDRAVAGRRLGLIDFEAQLLHPAPHSVKYNVQYFTDDYHILLPSPQNLYIAALFAVHEETDGDSLLQCKRDEVDLQAVRQVEAFLWALRKVNAHLARALDGLQLGALLIDTCNSRVRTMMLSAGLDAFNNKAKRNSNRQILAVVNTLPVQDARVANEILSRMNITTVSTTQAAAVTDARNKYILQVEAPLSSLVDAVVNVLKYLGWNYISVIYSTEDGEFTAGYKTFQTAAIRHGLCLAMEEGIATNMSMISHFSAGGMRSELVNQLVGARARGARAVLLWTYPEHTQALMQAISQEIAHGSLRREDLFWLIASPNGHAPQILRKFGNVLGGALIFRPHHRPIQEFQHHLQQAHHSAKENKNPWLLKYYQEGVMCNAPECKLLLEMGSHVDFNTVQAVYSVGAALAAMFSHLCGNSSMIEPDASCLNMYTRLDIQQALNRELRQTSAKRADGSASEDFRFTNSGMGNVPVEILNFRRNFRSRSRSLGDIYFERVGQFVDNDLRSLENVLAYRDSGDEVQVTSLSSQCSAHSNCPRCRRRYDSVSLTDWVTMMKPKQNAELEARQDVVLYIAATLSVHEASRNPLECGGEVSKQGIEQLEAFLWAIDQVNRNNSHLSLAAIALDTCGSIVKTSRDVSNFLNRQESNIFDGLNNTDINIVALLAGGDTELAGSVTDAVGHLGVAVLAPQAGGPPAQRKKYSPYPLQLAPSNAVRAASILALLHHLQWNCFSVMYHQDGVEYEDMFRYVEKHAASSIQLELTSGIPIPLASLNVTSLIRKCLRMLRAQKTDGSRIVVLMLPHERMKLIFRVVKSLEEEGQIKPGDFTWIMFGSEESIDYSAESSGAIVLQPKAGKVPEFEDHFRSLSLSSNSWNPWFSEFWSSVFHCRGATCHSDLFRDLHSYQFMHNPLVVNTINSVLAISHALGTVRRELCPDGSVCKAMKDISRVRRRLFEVAPHMAFVGVGLNAVAFSSAGENSHADIEVLNVHLAGNKAIPVSVGHISTSGKVQLDLEKMKSYVRSNRTEISLQESHSQCQGSYGSASGIPHVIEIGTTNSNNSKLSLLGVAPVHQQGIGHFNCGKLHPTTLLHLAALHYALSMINYNATILPGVDLGLILFDSCSRPSRAYNSIYNFLSFPKEALRAMTVGTEMQTRPKDIMAAVILDATAAEAVTQLLHAQSIAPLVVPVEAFATQRLQLASESSKESSVLRENLIHAMLSVARASHSHSMVVIHGTATWAELLNQQLQDYLQEYDELLCLAGVYALHSKNTKELIGAISSTKLMVTDDIIKTLRSGTVVILLLEDPEEIRAFLEVCRYISGLVFLTILQSWSVNTYAGHTIYTLHQILEFDETISGVTTEFQEWLSTNLLTTRDTKSIPFPASWLNEFQAMYKQDNNSWNTSLRLQHLFSMSDFSAGVQETINSIRTITRTLHQFFNRHCAHNFETNTFPECFNLNRSNNVQKIREFLQEELLPLSPTVKRHRSNAFSLWVGSERIGTWEQGIGLMISNTKYFQNYQSYCNSANCTICDQYGGYFTRNRQSVLYQTLQYPWAAALGGLSLFGAFLTILTALYFLAAAALPNSNMCGGTSVLGYLILLGLLVLFTANLSFVLTPTEATCGARRFLPGLAYTIIFAGMLLKVFTTWRLTSSAEPLVNMLTRPTGLLTMALALMMIQVLLAGGWLLLLPPQVYMLASKDVPLWRCYPKGHFESHLLLSLVYVILLITATATIALLCCSGSKLDLDDDNQLCYEARWILLASILVAAVFTFWGIVTVAMITPSHSDLASAVAHLLSAKILLLCLYVPKVCLYNRLRSGKSSPQTTLQHFYEISHFRSQPLKTLPSFIPQPPLINMDLPRVTSDDSESLEDPTQIVPSSLYSLDMFSQSSGSQNNIDDDDEGDGDHCEAGTNEFTAPQNTVILVDSKDIARHEAASYM
ncbi:uncharacterized protein [Periplaneta americana]|uniref:uncharacterized protein n=1 Tax=Periplaneta americana TaxID=6978 RepID=UPI0037E74D7D